MKRNIILSLLFLMIFAISDLGQARTRNLEDYSVEKSIIYYAFDPNPEAWMQVRSFLLDSWTVKRKSMIEILVWTYEGGYITRFYVEPNIGSNELSSWIITMEREERRPIGVDSSVTKRPRSVETTIYNQLEKVVTDEKKDQFEIILRNSKPVALQRI